ncbi:hypothetical protein NX059_012185 [Plenodomus lindquistii]|nr:hypothetical protein NX059_012185 [Plenodomus lindquistii]
MHYVAVSYCWPPREENPAPRRYQVRDLDGQVRSSRALDDVLDRAVDFANSCGLRMIWIDQECLPQPNAASSKDDWNEQELGIQAMDIVYNRAMVTAGLLSVEIDSQEVLTAIEILLSPDRTARQRMMNRQSCENILALMHKMEQDRWYTRAWVIEEAICAGEKLMIAFRRSPGLQFRSKFRVGYQAEKEDRPYHSLDDNPQGLETSLACINVCEFWRVLDDMKSLLVRDFARVGNFLHRVGNGPAHVDLDARWVLKEAEYLHPRFERANTLQQHLKMYAEGYYGKRPTINAAGALTLLKHRQCYFESDRLAIIANMCDYEFRLDTKAVQNNCESLRLAILSLALNNGDLSLLVREEYLPWMHVYSDNVYNVSMGNSLLFHDFFTKSPRVEHCRVRDFINIRLQRQQPAEVTSRGLLLPSYIWSVDREIDFTPLKYRWADTWEAVKCWNIILDKQKDETTEGYQTRQDAMVRRLAQPGIAEQALREFRELGHVPQTSTVWGGIDSAGIQMTRHVSAKRVKLVPEIRKVIAQIIFDILRYAWTISKEVALAKGLANSIV